MPKEDVSLKSADFDAWGRHLRSVVKEAKRRERRTRRSLPPIKTVYGAARYHVYRYYWILKNGGLLEELNAHLGERRGPRVDGVQLVLRLMEPERGELLPASRRSNIARELELAMRHRIAPKIVLGFLAEVGNQRDIIEAFNSATAPAAAERYRINSRK